jgi:hypothetical protein
MTQLHNAPMSSPVPGEVAQLAIGGQLGAHVVTFLPGKRMRQVAALGLLAVVFGGLAVMIGALTTRPPNNSNPTTVWSVIGLICVALIGLTLWPAMAGPLLSAKARERKFYIFERGLVHVGRKGTQVYRFDAATELRSAVTKVYVNGISTGTNYKLTVLFGDGRTLALNTFSTDMERFAPLLQRAVADAQVPRCLQVLATGGTLRFGKFLLTSGGIATDSQALVPWSQVRGLDVQQGNLAVYLHGKRLAWGRAQVAKTPNLYTLLDLAGYFLHSVQSGRTA